MLKTLSAVALVIALPAAAFAQAALTSDSKAQPNAQTCMSHSNMGQMKMDHGQMSGVDMSGMNMAGMDHSKMAASDHKMMESCAAAPKAGAGSDHEGHSR